MKNITSLLLIFVIGGICLRIHGGDSYDFFMISDTHFGTAERFCTDPKAPRHHRTRKDIHRADKAMPHYKALFSHIARSAGADAEILTKWLELSPDLPPDRRPEAIENRFWVKLDEVVRQ